MFTSNQTAKFTSKITGGHVVFRTVKYDGGTIRYSAEGLPTPRHKNTRLIGFFDTAEERNSAAEKWLKQWEKIEQYRAEQNEEIKEIRSRAVQEPTFEIGDIVYNSWGYEQTNVDWYKIISRTKCFVDLQPIGSIKNEAHGWMSGTCVPDPDQEHGKIERHKIYIYNGKEDGILFEHGWGNKWDGKPKSWSGYH